MQTFSILSNNMQKGCNPQAMDRKASTDWRLAAQLSKEGAIAKSLARRSAGMRLPPGEDYCVPIKTSLPGARAILDRAIEPDPSVRCDHPWNCSLSFHSSSTATQFELDGQFQRSGRLHHPEGIGEHRNLYADRTGPSRSHVVHRRDRFPRNDLLL